MDGNSSKGEHRFNLPSSSPSFLKNEYTEAFDALQAHCAHLDNKVTSLSTKLHILEEVLQAEQANSMRLEAELQEVQAKAGAVKDIQSQFLDNMSHELRTPLNGILGMAQLMRDLPLSKDLREYSEAILHSGKLLDHIISNLLDYSRLSQGDFPLESQKFELLTSLEAVVSQYAEAAATKGIELSFLPEKNIHCLADADQKRIQQIMEILLDNAIKFTKSGRVSVGAGIVPLEAAPHTPMLNLVISDTGIGINPDQIDHIFDPFWQADTSNTRTFGGVGMGLALCQKLITHMGGNIEAESFPATGTTITVHLPLTCQPLQVDPVDFSHLSIGLYGLSDTNRRVLTAYLRWWEIKPVEMERDGIDNESLKTRDIIFTSPEEQNAASLLAQCHKQNGRPKTPLFVGLVSSRKIAPAAKSLYDVILVQPILYRPLLDALIFAGETLKSHKAVKQNTPAPQPAHRATKVLLIEPNKINQKILTHMLHALDLEVEIMDTFEDIPTKLSKEPYLAALFNTTIYPAPGVKALKELTDHLALTGTHNLIGIRGRNTDKPAQTCEVAGVSKFLTLPTSIDDVKKLLLDE